MNARTLPGQLLHDLALPDEEEDDLQEAIQRARRLLDLIDGDRIVSRYDRIGGFVAEARADLSQAASLAELRWIAQD